MRTRLLLPVVMLSLIFVPAYASERITSHAPMARGEHKATLNGLDLWYMVSGKGPVCIFPAIGVNSDFYIGTMKPLEEQFTIVYLDTRGTGKSERPQTPQDYTWKHYVDDIDALRSYLGAERIWMMGEFTGGIVALHYALAHPNRIDSLMIVDSLAEDQDEFGLKEFETRWDALKKHPPFRPIVEELTDVMSTYEGWCNQTEAEFQKNLPKAMPLSFSTMDAYEMAYTRFKTAFDSITNSYEVYKGICPIKIDLIDRLDQIKCPILVVVGVNDYCASIKEAQRLHYGLPNSKLLVIENAGAFPWIEQPEEFFYWVRKYLPAVGYPAKIDIGKFPSQSGSVAVSHLIPPPAVPAVIEDYHGTKVVDPYRHLENLQNPEVATWYRAQGDYARSVIDRIPGRQGLIEKMREFDARKSANIGFLRITENDCYFYLKLTPTDEVGKLYFRRSYEGKEELLFDPATFRPDSKENYVITALSASDDGSKVVMEVSPNGSENGTLLIWDVAQRRFYPEQIDRCWLEGTPPSWIEDGSAFFYFRLRSCDIHDPNRLLDCKALLHIVGTDPATDREILSRVKYPELGIRPEQIPLVIYNKYSRLLAGLAVTVDQRLDIWFAPVSELSQDRIPWKRVIRPEDEITNFWMTDQHLYMLSFKKAPQFKLLRVPLTELNLSNAEVVIPENPRATLKSVALSRQGIFHTLARNGVQEELYYLPFNQTGPGRLVPLPLAAGSIWLDSKGFKFDEVWTSINGWTTENRRYRYIASSGEFRFEPLTSPAVYPEYEDLVVEEVMVRSHDGVEVPLSIIYMQGMVKDGTSPVFLMGYGAYGISISPFFSSELLLWSYHGGIVAVAHVRGGGELGEAWHKGGFKTTKPNTWKDMIACAEYLIGQRYTSPGKLVINSASAGGILVGRAMTERPDLFAAVIPQVGELNALRGENEPGGPINAPEFGTVKDPVECRALIEMDAYLNIQDGTDYPAALITAGMNDPRVIACQPGKFAARLQSANASKKPILFLVDYGAGHGMGNTKTKAFESLADVFSFGLWQTGHPKFQPETVERRD